MKKKWIAVSLGLLLLGLAYEVMMLPDVTVLCTRRMGVTALMKQRDAEARATGAKPRRFQIWVPYRVFPDHFKTAVLIGEDHAFFQHPGYDLREIKESLWRNWEEKRFVRGGSTLTQQLAKNLYLSTSKTPLRKLREFLIALKLERNLSKRRIFELYLNFIEWGDGIYGAEAASRTYFAKSVGRLSPGEAALLAAMIPDPRGMSPRRVTGRLRWRAHLILSRMGEYGDLDSEEYRRAVGELTARQAR